MAVPRYECGKAKNMEADFHIWDEETHRPKVLAADGITLPASAVFSC